MIRLAFNSFYTEIMYEQLLIRSFICNTKRPSVKQSMKWQVSSNFQIYPGKTDNPPGIKLDNFTDLIFRFSGLPAHTAN